jgi:hypothetical protein
VYDSKKSRGSHGTRTTLHVTVTARGIKAESRPALAEVKALLLDRGTAMAELWRALRLVKALQAEVHQYSNEPAAPGIPREVAPGPAADEPAACTPPNKTCRQVALTRTCACHASASDVQAVSDERRDTGLGCEGPQIPAEPSASASERDIDRVPRIPLRATFAP